MQTNIHLLWLWLWFFIGAITYWVKRAFYLITGPNPIASNTSQFIKVAGVPLGFRFIVDSGFYWLLFSPAVVQRGFEYLGWTNAAWVISVVTQFAVCALFFGLFVDSIADIVIGALFPKIPFLKDWWPQMPAPLPKS